MKDLNKQLKEFYDNIDFDLLVTQKENLLEMFKKTMPRAEREALDGVIHLLDALQDINYK